MIKLPHLSFFLDFNWLNIWWHTYAEPEDHLFIILLYDQNSLVAIAPFYIKDQTLRMLGTGESEHEEVASEYLDILCAPKHFQNVTNSLADTLMDCLFSSQNVIQPYCQKPQQAVAHIILDNYLANSCLALFAKRMSKSFFHASRCVGTAYLCQLPATQEQYQQQLSPSFRKKLARHKNQWHNQLSGEFKAYRNFSNLDEGLNHLRSLHQKRWKQQGKPGVFSAQKFAEFHEKFMRLALRQNWLELWVLFARGQAISAIYAITYNETCYFYQSGLDTDFKPNLSPGFLSHFLLIEQCIKRQLSHYDFMKGAQERSYKQNFANISRDLFRSQLAIKKASNLGFAMNNKLKQARDLLLWKNQ
ncbi:GNAT family N-acetyltransferase [Thalassotalea litorea]|uniref:GNAT family N-acetyltransferase n=1 Tax=Thalassotalea litorea TaxID=2020715 RepID=UPI0037367158